MKKVVWILAIVSVLSANGVGCASVSSGVEVDRYSIVVDAGHGGVDSGTIGVITSNKESELNLLIANALGEYLTQAGVKVTYTRQTNDGLYGELTNGFKMRDMQARRDIITSANPDIVVSIHLNKFAIPSRRGVQVYYQTGRDSGETLAGSIQDIFNTHVNLPQSGRGYEAQRGDFYMCRCVSVPACIVECGFLSNPEDDRLLDTAEYRDQIAYYIYAGIMNYLMKR